MGGLHQTGHLPNEDQKLDSLRPRSREMERGRSEGQNFQLLKEVQHLEEEEGQFINNTELNQSNFRNIFSISIHFSASVTLPI